MAEPRPTGGLQPPPEDLISRHAVKFGVFEVDLRARELRKNGLKIGLQDQPFQVLTLLLKRPGEVLTREELRNKLWPADTFVDFDDGLNTAIRKLRLALGDSAESPRFVETLPRHGYRFIAPVEDLGRVEPKSGLLPAGEGLPAASRSPAVIVLSATLAAIVLLFAGLYFQSHRRATLNAANPQRIRSLVVLPLANLTGDPNQDYFVDAMTDSLITDLAQIHELRVISATSSTHYKGTKKTLPEIARELSVDGVVEGTVFRSGEKVRITAQLVDAPTDRHLWARSYERDLRDVIRMQDEVARDIAGEIKVKLTPQEQLRLANAAPVNTEAYQLYLQGEYFGTKVTEDFLRKSIGILEQSIALDPNYAPAHAALADAHEALSTNGYAAPSVEFPKARAELIRALDLDEGLAETHADLGQVQLTYDRDWSSAEKELQRAVDLNPNSAPAHEGKAIYYLALGRFDEAVSEAQRTLELDPVGMDASLYVGHICILAGRYDEGIRELKKTLELDPNFLPAHAELAFAYMRLGKRDEAANEYQKTRSAMPAHQALILDQWMAPVEILLGKRAEARGNLEWWMKESARRHTDAYILAAFSAELGLKDRAFALLEQGFKQRSPSMVYLKFDSNFPADIHSDPRFLDILRRLNFPSEAETPRS